MKILKDKKIIALISILMVFTISYFIVANKISYAFVNNYDAKYYHEKVKDIIEKGALSYAEEHKEEIAEKGFKYLTVQELIDNSYLVPDAEGNIRKPLNDDKTFNNDSIEIKLEKDNFVIEILEKN